MSFQTHGDPAPPPIIRFNVDGRAFARAMGRIGARRNHDRIVVKPAEGGWMFVYRSSNGRTLASSEVYTKRVWALRMAERVGGGRVRVVVEDAT